MDAAMDASLSAEERAALRAETVAALRRMVAEQRAKLPARTPIHGSWLLTSPQEREQFHRLLDQLRRAGERIYATDYDWSPVIPPSKSGKRPGERIATDRFVATITRVLTRLDRESRGVGSRTVPKQ
jgi:hypothetical protein